MLALQRGEAGRFVPTPPPRSAERQQLAEAIQRHAGALDRRNRIQQADERLRRLQFDELVPRADAARQALEQARQRAPAARIDRLLADDPGEDVSLAAAEAKLAGAERLLADCRSSREVLAEEAKRVETEAEGAEHALDRAVQGVIRADEATSSLVSAYRAACARVLQLSASLQTVGLELPRAEARGFELVVRGAPLNSTPFATCPLWGAIARALREDPDAPLPGLPLEPEPEPTPTTQAA